MNIFLLLNHNTNGDIVLNIIIFRTILFYFLIIFSYKLMGKRELGELSLVDYVISTVLSQIIAMSIENYKDPIIYTLLPLFLLVFLQISLSLICLKSKKIRDVFDGKISLIINNGTLNIKEMINQRYSLDDLLSELREKGYRSIDEVGYAILEPGGKLSVFDKNNNIFPLPLIIDGNIELDNLKYINKDKKWLLSILKEKNINCKNVFYSFLKDKDLFIISKN